MIEIDSGTSREDSASETSDLRYTQFSLVPRLPDLFQRRREKIGEPGDEAIHSKRLHVHCHT